MCIVIIPDCCPERDYLPVRDGHAELPMGCWTQSRRGANQERPVPSWRSRSGARPPRQHWLSGRSHSWSRGSACAGRGIRCVSIVIAVPAAGLGAGDGEGLVDLDGDLVTGLGGEVGFVDAVGVGLDALDGGAGVLREGCCLDLGGGGPGEGRLVAVSAVFAVPAAGLGAGDGEGL